jgi:hypothetical protein
MMARSAIILSFVLLASCGRKAADATPEGALDAFLSACESVSSDPHASAKAFALLAPSARRSLEDRAKRASAITGKAVSPEQLLVPSWTPIRFEVAKTTTTFDAGKDGPTATVDVFGLEESTQHVRIPMEREGEAWRVRVVIPPP